jgi:4-aminobutyrate aminotransferase-like enzyme
MAQPTTVREPAPAYDVAAEAARTNYPDVVVAGRRVNRGTAVVDAQPLPPSPPAEASRRLQQERLFPTTHDEDSPVLELDWPIHGPFALTPRGVVFDAYHGVAQRLLDPHNPRFARMVKDLLASDLLLRREIATDDYLAVTSGGAVRTPADLGELWDRTMRARWPDPAGYRVFLSASGAEAIEAALKLSHVTAYKRFVARFGMDVFRKVQAALGIREAEFFRSDPGGLRDHPVFEDYPFQAIACEGAFHGRTLGALSLTWSKRSHRLGFPKAWNVHHVPYNAPGDPFAELVDRRGIQELLATPGELAKVREQRRIPKDLLACFVAEPFQGEGGYVPGDPAFFRKARALCDETGALLVADEVQSVGRTGSLFLMERLGVRPDVVATAKGMVLGVTIASADLAKHLHPGWHSNTWGGGRVFDTTFAWETLDTLLHHRDPVLAPLSYLDNVEVKGARLAAGLDRLVERHPKVLVGHRGVGLLRAILVRRRPDVIRAAWRRGLKLLGCGWLTEVAPIRLILLADTLAREVDELLRVLDLALGDVEKA